jgi:hypothetical protein
MITLTREEAEKMLHYMDDGGTYTDDYGKLIETLRARLAQPEPEPLEYWNAVEGWVNLDEVRQHFDSVSCGTIYKKPGKGRQPLYHAPPQREWQGLTDEEIKEILDCGRPNLVNIKKAEQKLKEKNT